MKLTHVSNWTKDKGSLISSSNDSEKGLMTSYTRDGDDVIHT